MAEESEGHAESGRRSAPAVLIVLAVIALVGLVALALFYNSYFYGTYICTHCGAKQIVDRRSIGRLTYRERVTVSDSAVSRALNAQHKQTCRHDWYLIRFGSGGLRGHADGGTWFFVLKMLIRDDSFARELADLPHPRQVWHGLMRAGEKSPEEMDSLVGAWWYAEGDLEDREPFADWWAANETRVRQLASAVRP